jgi:hypothetical protein
MEKTFHSALTITDVLNSPSGNLENTRNMNNSNQLSTPKVNKSLNDSKSPLAKLKLKKSKRRECTPAYSPKFEENIKQGKFCLTEKKIKESQRLNFDGIEVDNKNHRLSCLPEKNVHPKTENPKKNFISLIEESLNEVNEHYYDFLGSQQTPDVIFRNIFSDEKAFLNSAQSSLNNTFSYEINENANLLSNLIPTLESILEDINNKKVNSLSNMKTGIIYIESEQTFQDISYHDFFVNLKEFSYDIPNAAFSQESNSLMGYLLIPGSIKLTNDQVTSVRLFFEVSLINGNGEARLAYIEIYP